MNAKNLLKDNQELFQKKSLSVPNIIKILVNDKKQGRENTSHILLPILFDIVGEENFMDILRVFAGVPLNFPSISTLRRACLILAIWNEVSKWKRKDQKKMDKLSIDYDCDANKIYKIAKKILK